MERLLHGAVPCCGTVAWADANLLLALCPGRPLPCNGNAGVDFLSCLPAACCGKHACYPLQGLVLYRNNSSVLSDSVFSPSLLTESRMLYFWFSEHSLSSLASAAFLDGRLVLNLTGEKLQVIPRGVPSLPHTSYFGEKVKNTLNAMLW